MSDLQAYIDKRQKTDGEFRQNFDKGYEVFRVGVVLRQLREAAGLTRQELADRLKTRPAQISRIENHSGQVRLEMIEAYAGALGKLVSVVVQ